MPQTEVIATTSSYEFRRIVADIVRGYRGEESPITDKDVDIAYTAIKNLHHRYAPAYIMHGLVGKRPKDITLGGEFKESK